MIKKELPKAYKPGKYEDKIYKKWEESGYFNPDNLSFGKTQDKNCEKDAKNYSIVMPPPNVTGTLHAGHASMLAIEDILIRYHRMKGERTLWLPGTDHAAIATQTKVEKLIKEKGETRHTLGRVEFLKRVDKFAQESHDTIANQTRKMGSSCDWSREAFTLDETRSKAVKSVFKLMYEDGLIYRGERIVNWCPRCHSTLADDEVEYKETKSKLYYFKYDNNFPITIATTRPETKLGDTAVAVNPKDERYKEFIGKEYTVNFVGVLLKIKIIADREVDKDFGTGALGVTPAHSAVDWQMAKENSLDIKKVIDEDGIIHEGFGEYSGLSAIDAREKVVKNLEKAKLIEKEEEIDNSLSLCYRCDTLIEPLPSLQWFIDVNKKSEKLEGRSIKETCIESVRSGVFGRKKINIIPERFEKNYFNWMDNLRDWCISRQIWYGHQIPVWYRKKSKAGSQKSKVNEDEVYVGVEAPEGIGWVQDADTLDTWFSSGMWTFSTLTNKPDQISIKDGKLKIDSEDFRNFHPTNVLETGYDILFFWVARMIIMTTYAINDIPFQDVYLHGLILDEKGKKMSKSKGNVIDPLDMISKYGTDAVRLSLVIGSTPGNDSRLSEEKIEGYRNLVNKLWNVSRYILQTTDDSKQTIEINKMELTLADEWILGNLNTLVDVRGTSVTRFLDKYEFSLAGETLREFTWGFFADWYLEVVKIEKNKDGILLYILRTLLKLWHPFIPFVTETIWKEFNDTDLIIEEWPINNSKIISQTNDVYNKFNLFQSVITSIRNARAENKVEPSKKIKAVIVCDKQKELIESQAELIKNLKTGISELEVVGSLSESKGFFTGAQDDSMPLVYKGGDDAIKVVCGDIIIYLIGAKDEAKDKERITKEKVRLEKVISIIKNKLDNKEFVSNAPEQIVSNEKEKLAGFEKELKELK